MLPDRFIKYADVLLTVILFFCVDLYLSFSNIITKHVQKLQIKIQINIIIIIDRVQINFFYPLFQYIRTKTNK